MTINDGGPAFPIPDVPYPNGNVQHGWNGMSLRDWFAGQALTGVDVTTAAPPADVIAAWCYDIADEMLKAREVKP